MIEELIFFNQNNEEKKKCIYSTKYQFFKVDYTNCYYQKKKDKTLPLGSIDEIIENASEFSKKKILSCLIQYLFEKENEEIKIKLFDSLKKDIIELSKDFYGNYVIQGILENCNLYIKTQMYKILINKEVIIELSTKIYSCNVILKLIDCINILQIKEILDLIKDNLYELFINPNGNLVIQKIIKKLDGHYLKCIYTTILENIKLLIKNKYGCLLIQLLLRIENNNKEEINKIIEEIYKNDFIELCKDQYCNYLLQCILNHCNREYFDITFEKIKGNIYELSKKEFSSHALPIIEIIIIHGKDEQKKDICKEILENDKKYKNYIENLIKDKFCNKMLIKIIDEFPKDIAEGIIKRIVEIIKDIPENEKKEYIQLIWNIQNKLKYYKID